MRQILNLILAALMPLAACRHNETPAPVPGHDSYHRRAWEMRDTGAPADEFIAMQLRAVDELRAGRCDDDPVEVLAQAGMFYDIAGDYVNAEAYLREAADWLRDHPDHGDTEGVIQLYGNLGGLYVALGMGDEALEANTRAMQVSRRLGGRYMSDLYRFRATVFDYIDRPDSVVACLDSALAVVNSANIEGDADEMRAGILGERADYILEHELWPDSVDAIVSTLESLRENPHSRIDGSDFTLGRGYLLQGRVDEGLAMMERALESYRRQGDTHGVAFALPPLMDAYARYGRLDRLAAEFPMYSAIQDTLLNQEKLSAIIGADVRNRASILRAENEALRLRQQLVREHTVIGAAIAVILLLALVAFIWLQRRKHKRRMNIQKEKMETLLAERIELNSRLESLKQQIESQQKDKAETDLLNLAVLDKSRETEFRATFGNVYPRFLPLLRRDYPAITPANELVCMMIYLNKSTDEIALALGISRDSVNKTRYRLRRTFALPRETDLDTFITSRPA